MSVYIYIWGNVSTFGFNCLSFQRFTLLLLTLKSPSTVNRFDEMFDTDNYTKYFCHKLKLFLKF